MYTITNTSVTFILSNYWTVTYLYGSALTNCIVHVLIVVLVVVKLLNSKLVVFALTNCNVHNVVLVITWWCITQLPATFAKKQRLFLTSINLNDKKSSSDHLETFLNSLTNVANSLIDSWSPSPFIAHAGCMHHFLEVSLCRHKRSVKADVLRASEKEVLILKWCNLTD